MQAEFADIFPAGILRQFCIGVKEIFLYETVYMKCIKCYNLSFYKEKLSKVSFRRSCDVNSFISVKVNDIIQNIPPDLSLSHHNIKSMFCNMKIQDTSLSLTFMPKNFIIIKYRGLFSPDADVSRVFFL